MEWTCRLMDLDACADEAAYVQARAFGFGDAERYSRVRVMRRHAEFPAVRALGAWSDDGRLIGFAYGYPNLRDQWWSLVIQPHLEAGGNVVWLDESFVVGELHVLPEWQQHGAGSTLLRLLCRGQDRRRALLSAVDADTPARRMYRRMGFADLAVPVVFPGNAVPYTIMGAELPLRESLRTPAL